MSVIAKKISSRHSQIKRPRVTEKATDISAFNVYTFEVEQGANKTEIKKLINQKYKVKPVRVNIVNLPAKKIIVRGHIGSKPAVKKAMVYLKKGDKLELV